MLKLKALGHRILVEQVKIESKTEGGIFLPQQVKDQDQAAQTVGRIVAIGPTAWVTVDTGEPWAKIGDLIVFAKYGGTEVVHPETGKIYVVLNDQDLLVGFEGKEVKKKKRSK